MLEYIPNFGLFSVVFVQIEKVSEHYYINEWMEVMKQTLVTKFSWDFPM